MGTAEPTSLSIEATLDEEELMNALNSTEELSVEETGILLDALSAAVDEVHPPRAIAGDDQRHQSEDDGTCLVLLDGRGSYDPQDQIVQWSWLDERGRELSNTPQLKLRCRLGDMPLSCESSTDRVRGPRIHCCSCGRWLNLMKESMLPSGMALTEPWIEHFFVGPLQMRCSVVTDRSNGDTIIVDGGDEPQRIIDWIDRYEGPGPIGPQVQKRRPWPTNKTCPSSGRSTRQHTRPF